MIHAEFYRLNRRWRDQRQLCDILLQNVQNLYEDYSPFDLYFKIFSGAIIAKANALANLNHLPQAIEVINELKDWQDTCYGRWIEPILYQPLWLLKLASKKDQIKSFLHEQKEIKHGLNYLIDTYELCLSEKISPDKLALEAGNEVIFIKHKQESSVTLTIEK